MNLKVKKLGISTGGPLIALLHKKDAQLIDATQLDRIKIKTNSHKIVSAIDIAEKETSIKQGQIGLFNELLKEFKVKNKQPVTISIEEKPESINLIRKKLQGKKLNDKEIDLIVKDLVDNKLTEIESTYFVSACYTHGLSLEETASLTRSIVKHGGKLNFKKHPIVDKHCVSGVPGNRTTMVITPIVAAAGLKMPKTSSRSITSPSGTSDSMEVLAPVTISKERIIQIVQKTNACMVWGGSLGLASADDKLIKLERPLSLDPEGMLLASIMAKKSAADSTHVLIDIPVGKEAKIKDKSTARRLRRKFIKLGKILKLKTKVIITDGSQPIGNGIGPALEARDVLLVLQNKGPEDLKKKSLKMASILMKMVGIKNSKKKAKYLLESGLAYQKMKEIIKAQGGNPNIKPEQIKLGKFTYTLKSPKSGKIKYISNNSINKIAKASGSPNDKSSGVYIYVKLKDKIKKDSNLLTIYSESKEKLSFAKKILEKENVVIIS